MKEFDKLTTQSHLPDLQFKTWEPSGYPVTAAFVSHGFVRGEGDDVMLPYERQHLYLTLDYPIYEHDPQDPSDRCYDGHEHWKEIRVPIPREVIDIMSQQGWDPKQCPECEVN